MTIEIKLLKAQLSKGNMKTDEKNVAQLYGLKEAQNKDGVQKIAERAERAGPPSTQKQRRKGLFAKIKDPSKQSGLLPPM